MPPLTLDPDRLLAEDWTPEIPGINAPGNYFDYAADLTEDYVTLNKGDVNDPKTLGDPPGGLCPVSPR